MSFCLLMDSAIGGLYKIELTMARCFYHDWFILIGLSRDNRDGVGTIIALTDYF